MKTKQRKPRYSDARKIATLRHFGRPSIRPEDWDAEKRDVAPTAIYNHWPAVSIERAAQSTTETRRQADTLFSRLRFPAGSYKAEAKRNDFQPLFHAAKRAVHTNGCVRYSRRKNDRAMLPLIEAAVEAGLFLELRSPPGSPKMSRLVPLSPIEEHASRDPWEFDAERMQQFVWLRERSNGKDDDGARNDGKELHINWSFHIASETQKRLELVNAVNSKWRIEYEPWNAWRGEFSGFQQLRPIHYAVFTERWDWNGRLCTGKYGHQRLGKAERKTIRFDDERSTELDFSGMHSRLLYHINGIDYTSDPYALWGAKTTEPMRFMAKQLINAAINAKTRKGAISACNNLMNPRTKTGKWKEGRAAKLARKLRSAARITGLTFKSILPLAEQRHSQIDRYLCTDYGMQLMRLDSMIAIDVLYHFAKLGIPCLGVHDSFIVPESQRNELKRAMTAFYVMRFGFPPVIK